MTETELLRFLDEQHLPYQRVEHPPVYTCEEAERLRVPLPAIGTKNLFLCDKKARRFFLVVTACEKSVDLERLADLLGISKLRFGSEENLGRLLGVSRGSVTTLGLVHDHEHQIALWVDAEVWAGENFLCHPLVNTATLLLSKETLQRFFELTGHPIHLFEN